MTQKYDWVIAGAGPGGAMAARTATEKSTNGTDVPLIRPPYRGRIKPPALRVVVDFPGLECCDPSILSPKACSECMQPYNLLDTTAKT